MGDQNVVHLEVCIESIESGMAAQIGGADRVELCANLTEGGTTPSAGMIRRARAAIDLPIHCMIRPRGGDFLYTETEFDVMVEDVKFAVTSGCDGVVFGLLLENGHIDVERTERLAEEARPLKTTFHRAFDMTSNPLSALDSLIDLEFDFILTSGMESSAWNGRDYLKNLVTHAGERIEIMAGGGVNHENVSELIRYTGVNWVHGSASETVESQMLYRNPQVDFTSAFHPSDYIRRQTQVKPVQNIIKSIAPD